MSRRVGVAKGEELGWSGILGLDITVKSDWELLSRLKEWREQRKDISIEYLPPHIHQGVVKGAVCDQVLGSGKESVCEGNSGEAKGSVEVVSEVKKSMEGNVSRDETCTGDLDLNFMFNTCLCDLPETVVDKQSTSLGISGNK